MSAADASAGNTQKRERGSSILCSSVLPPFPSAAPGAAWPLPGSGCCGQADRAKPVGTAQREEKAAAGRKVRAWRGNETARRLFVFVVLALILPARLHSWDRVGRPGECQQQPSLRGARRGTGLIAAPSPSRLPCRHLPKSRAQPSAWATSSPTRARKLLTQVTACLICWLILSLWDSNFLSVPRSDQAQTFC